MFDYASYRKIVLNLIDRSKYHLVPRREIHKYKNYIKHVDKKEIKMYTISEFKKKFGGKIGLSQLQQGVFGRDEYDIVVMNRKKRGMKGM